MAEALRLGVIGCGMIAQAHAAALRFLRDDGLVEIVAVHDPDPEAVDRFLRITGPGPKVHPEGLGVVDDPAVGAVVVVAPTRFHLGYVRAVADAHKPLFTEKPLAPTFTDVLDIVVTTLVTAFVTSPRPRSSGDRASVS